MEESVLTKDLLAEWRSPRTEPGLALEIDDSSGASWSLAYAYLQAVKAMPGELQLCFHRYRVRVRGGGLSRLYEQVVTHAALLLEPGVHRLTGAQIEEIVVESSDGSL